MPTNNPFLTSLPDRRKGKGPKMKRPWMPLYVGDFTADTMHLGATETGIYIRLLMHCWQHGTIPTDGRQLALIAHCDTRLWHQYRTTILPFFCAVDASTMHHKRITSELLRSEELSNKRRASALQKQSKSSAIALQLHTQSQSQSQSKKDISPKPVSSDTKRESLSKAYPEDFEQFWLAYPDRTNNSKGEALMAWEGLSTEDRARATASLPAFTAYCRRSPDYRVVHCVRFLKQRRFDSWGERAARPIEFRV